MRKENIIDAINMKKYSTHIEILNDLFGRKYKGHQKASVQINDRVWIWFPKFLKDKLGNIKVAPSGWQNVYNDDFSVITTKPPVSKKTTNEKKIVLIFAMLEPQEYTFLGAYKNDIINSNEYAHYYLKITDKVKLIGDYVDKIELIIEDSKYF